MLLQSVSRASVRGGGSVGAESGQAEPNPARRGPPRPKTQPGAFPGSLRSGGGGISRGCRSHLRTSRTPPAISDPHATIGQVLTDAQTDWAGKWARRGTRMALESTLVPFVWPRMAAGCDQGPPSVEPRWRRCSVQIQIRSESTSGGRSEPYSPAMCTPISALAPISGDIADLRKWRCRKAVPIDESAGR